MAYERYNEEAQEKFIETEHYTFAPSISKRCTVDGKKYYVRSYFTGDKDFNEAVTQLATKQAYKRNAG